MTSSFYREQRPWSLAGACSLLDMSGGVPEFKELGQQQLTAAVALHRMLLQHGVAYLADEVGMGKTYVALAVVALMRHLKPDLRVLYVMPSQNVQAKWHERELPAFIRRHVTVEDGRVKHSGGIGDASAAACDTVKDWARTVRGQHDVLDTFLRFSALSFHLSDDADAGRADVSELAGILDLPAGLGDTRDKAALKQKAASLLNSKLPRYDLVVVDEAHLLKDGSGENAASRVQFLATALGTLGMGTQRRFRGALLLSGTPFDRDLSQLARQFQIFGQSDRLGAPHRRIEELAVRRRQGANWDELHEGLAPYLVRRVQRLPVGGRLLSRNQYRVEHRSAAAISLQKDNRPEAIQQRLFTALVQKTLVDRLGGQFPMAMFSSWEAYTVPREPSNSPRGHEGDPLDAGKAAKRTETKAIDTGILATILSSHKELFGIPPHPKLEHEATRLGRDAFTAGNKQLVFVRRLASIGDLYGRLNLQYDRWLSRYLGEQGLCTERAWLSVCDARNKGTGEVAPPAVSTAVSTAAQMDPEASTDTLFSWFFRGQLDARGKQFAGEHSLEEPRQLRQRLIGPDSWECIIGEIDWRGFLLQRAGLNLEIGYDELAAASMDGAADHRIGRYRRLQYAFLKLASERAYGQDAIAIAKIRHYYQHYVIRDTKTVATAISSDLAKELLNCPTIALALVLHPMAHPVMTQWDAVWESLRADTAGNPDSTLAGIDLFVEVMYSLMRLDHPFIDLYIAVSTTSRSRTGLAAAEAMVRKVVNLCEGGAGSFGTASILFALADGWPQLAKTNFADFGVHNRDLARHEWRQEIQRLVTPEGPVEWASGDQRTHRSAVARRFRMPGYPSVLVATSVLQEGEDLHVFCDRVTHFGISGSPIGIEQKNGRVDRIGSLAQRRLAKEPSIVKSGIQIWFPHLAESLEWYQIRELCVRLNDYIRSMHKVVPTLAERALTLDAVVGDAAPIPEKLEDALRSPFEPIIVPSNDDVQASEVMAVVRAARRETPSVSRGINLPVESKVMEIFEQQLFELRPNARRRAFAVESRKGDLQRQFNSKRLGKLVNGCFYVTLPSLSQLTKDLVADARLPLLLLASSDSRRRGLMYPGFDTARCSAEQLETIVAGLRNAIGSPR